MSTHRAEQRMERDYAPASLPHEEGWHLCQGKGTETGLCHCLCCETGCARSCLQTLICSGFCDLHYPSQLTDPWRHPWNENATSPLTFLGMQIFPLSGNENGNESDPWTWIVNEIGDHGNETSSSCAPETETLIGYRTDSSSLTRPQHK